MFAILDGLSEDQLINRHLHHPVGIIESWFVASSYDPSFGFSFGFLPLAASVESNELHQNGSEWIIVQSYQHCLSKCSPEGCLVVYFRYSCTLDG